MLLEFAGAVLALFVLVVLALAGTLSSQLRTCYWNVGQWMARILAGFLGCVTEPKAH